MKDKDSLILESLYSKVVEEAKTKSKKQVGYLLSNKVSPLTSKQKKKLKKELHSGEVKVEEKYVDIEDFPDSEEEHIVYNNVNYYVPYKRTGETPDDFDILAIIPHEGQAESDEPLYNYHDGVQSLHDNPNEDIRKIYQIAGRKIYDKIEDDLIEKGYYDKPEYDWDSERKSRQGY
jgi:hypothetical protein